eukprot:SAG31_NODE_4020_length_3660_cov_2.623701_4_plen_116_part_00
MPIAACVLWYHARQQAASFHAYWSEGSCTVQTVQDYAWSECDGWLQEAPFNPAANGMGDQNVRQQRRFLGDCDDTLYYKTVAGVVLTDTTGQQFHGVQADGSVDYGGAPIYLSQD